MVYGRLIACGGCASLDHCLPGVADANGLAIRVARQASQVDDTAAAPFGGIAAEATLSGAELIRASPRRSIKSGLGGAHYPVV
jgi:hypothetical protein